MSAWLTAWAISPAATSNPARSFGPALVAAFAGNSAPIAALWVFIVGPFVGAALAALVWKKLDA